MKLFNSVFVLVATIITVSAFAGTTTRKPAAASSCGSAAHAARLAATQAEEDTNSKKCTVTADPTDGPAGSFFVTYHVSLNCDGKAVNYDAESHSVGMPEHLTCASTVTPAGQFAAHNE